MIRDSYSLRQGSCRPLRLQRRSGWVPLEHKGKVPTSAQPGLLADQPDFDNIIITSTVDMQGFQWPSFKKWPASVISQLWLSILSLHQAPPFLSSSQPWGHSVPLPCLFFSHPEKPGEALPDPSLFR